MILQVIVNTLDAPFVKALFQRSPANLLGSMPLLIIP